MWQEPRPLGCSTCNPATSSNGNGWDYHQAGPSTVSDCNHCGFCKLPLDMDASFIKRIKCGHTLHLSCINENLPTTKRCPICRTPVKWRDVTDKCAVCLDPLLQGSDRLITPNCRHTMHHECVKQLLVTRCRCPVCRKSLHNITDLISDPEEESEEESEESEESVEEEEEEETVGDDDDYYDTELDEESDYDYDDPLRSSDDDNDNNVPPPRTNRQRQPLPPLLPRLHRSRGPVEHNEEYCFYCGEAFVDSSEPQKRIKCGHLFHMRCANINLPIKRACGICNKPVGKWVNTNDMCVICKKMFKETDKRFTSICQHELHEHCLKKYKKVHCPICGCKLEGKSSDMVCAICLENFASTKGTFVTKCDHRFHATCLGDWRSIDNVCPICRKRL